MAGKRHDFLGEILAKLHELEDELEELEEKVILFQNVTYIEGWEDGEKDSQKRLKEEKTVFTDENMEDSIRDDTCDVFQDFYNKGLEEGLKSGCQNKVVKNLAILLADKGKSIEEIAEIAKCDVKIVESWLKEMEE